MAAPKTMKHGHILILEDGSNRPVWSESSALYSTGFVDNSGGAVYLAAVGGDLTRKTGGDLLAIDGPTDASAVVINETHAIVHPVVWQDGSNTHLWFGYDAAGAAAYTVYYTVSTDAGLNWSARSEVLTLGSGGTWNDVSVYPVGVYKDTVASKYYLHVMGNDGASDKIGHYEAGTASNLTLTGSYSEYGSNPVFPSGTDMGNYATVCCDGLSSDGSTAGRYHMWAQNTSVVDETWYASSEDGLTWLPGKDEIFTLLSGGPDSTYDDNVAMRPTGSLYRNGYYYLFYQGEDSATQRPFTAFGPAPDRLYKAGNIGWLHADSASEVYYCLGDLTYSDGRRAHHMLDRGKPGAAIDATSETFQGAFSFYMQAIGPAGVAAAGTSDALNLWQDMMLTSPSIGQPYDGTLVNMCHIVYRIDDSAGAAETFFLFPRCTIEASITEGAEGNVANCTFTCHGDRKPYKGNY